MTKQSNPDYETLASEFEEMFKSIDKMQWDIGKRLYECGIVSDGQRQKLGQRIGRNPKTLKIYYEVYVNFHERWPDGRPGNISHGVLEELLRLADETLRDAFFERYAQPTVAQAEQYVNQHLHPHGRKSPRQTESTSVMIGGVVFSISATAAGSGRVEITGASKVGEVKPSLQEGSWTFDYLP
jgi:hypothetical protein